MNNNLKFYKVSEVAELLELTTQTVHKMIKTQEIEAYNFAATKSTRPFYKISSAEIQRLLEDRKV